MSNTRSEFEKACEEWIASEKGAIKLKSSHAVYRAIWNAFARFVGPDVSLLDVTSGMVGAYLESRDAAAAARGNNETGNQKDAAKLTLRYQARVARLIERIMEHHATTKGVSFEGMSPLEALMKANPALGAALTHDQNNEPALEYLSERDHQKLKDLLITSCAADLELREGREWSDMRDRASMALQLGAGLTPSDVREVTMEEIGRQKKGARGGDGSKRFIRVPKNGKIAERNVLVDAWAAKILDGWVTTLRDTRSNGLCLYVFPGAQDGGGPGQWSKPGQHKQTRKILAGLGIKGSSFQLRHTWGMQKLREGESERQVAKWLGVLDGGEVMKRYREALDAENGHR
jgi:integrase